ncbi:MAG: DUF489 family protein [Mariprofundaceae bacterium]|nr:DUF489 family protein [Mariprofundaceae bacterium]
MQPKPEQQRALALAALTQVAYLVESIAQEGRCERSSFEQSMDAFLDSDYLQQRDFTTGSSKTRQLLQGSEIKHAKHILSHCATLINIEKKLNKQADMLQYIAQEMQNIHKKVHYFASPYHDNVYAAIAHLYGETISQLKPRVIVRGKPEHLKQKHHTEQIRCLLFSGIRAAWVWRTHGGNTLRLIFERKKIIQQLKLQQHDQS